MISDELQAKQERLLDRIRELGDCVVGFSGGVDSSVLSKAAALAIGDRAVAVTGVSASSSTGEREMCVELAERIGILHIVAETREMDDVQYIANDADRCYYCKRIRFEQILEYAKSIGVKCVVEGSNADDNKDYRPGHRAVDELGVYSPLADAGLTKAEVRQLAKEWGLPNWDRPSTPCLSTRIAYGIELTPDRLRMIDQAEQFLAGHGLRSFRVRYHAEELARIEVPGDQIERLASEAFRVKLIDRFQSIGFRYVTLDLAGFQSGSMNRGLADEQLERG